MMAIGPSNLAIAAEAVRVADVVSDIEKDVHARSATTSRGWNALQPVGVARGSWGTNGCISEQVVVGVLRAADVIVVVATGLLAYFARFSMLEDLNPFEIYALVIAGLLVANVFQFAGLYGPGLLESVLSRFDRLLAAWSFIVLFLITLGFAVKSAHEASRLWVGLWALFGWAGLFAVRLLFRHQVRRWQRGGWLTRKLVLAGAGEHGRRLAEHLRRVGDPSVRIVGVFDDRKDRVPARVAGHRVRGGLDDLLRFVREHPVDEVVVALPWAAEDRLITWMKRLGDLPVDVRLCPDMIGFHLVHRGVTPLGGVPLLNVFERPLSGWNHITKALEDRLLAALILALVSPLMLVVALAVRLDSPGPALFRQRRYGFNNRVIEVFKFRTMHNAVAETGLGPVVQARRGDPRLTRVGRFLRRTSLDELPQLINVLRGEMSLVGPRPHAVAHNEQYANLIDAYLGRHRVKPGITGWAQINGLRGETETLDKMEQRVRYDLYYIENWSLAFDLRILVRTLLVAVGHPNAY
jgi:Undecaprenyl-phosphate glucose phosphotransferase